MKYLKLNQELILIGITMLPITFLLIVFKQLPDTLPMHWNIRGEIDGYASKYTPIFLSLGIYVLMTVVFFFDPKKKNYEKFIHVLFRIRLFLILFFAVINSTIIYYSLGNEIAIQRIIGISILILFTIIGNYMINIKPNWFLGIRTPWTLSNDEVWSKTHRLAGKMWFFGGLIMLFLSFFLGEAEQFFMILAGVIILCIVPIVYSYVLFKGLKNNDSTH